jgi:hypothetical protein
MQSHQKPYDPICVSIQMYPTFTLTVTRFHGFESVENSKIRFKYSPLIEQTWQSCCRRIQSEVPISRLVNTEFSV